LIKPLIATPDIIAKTPTSWRPDLQKYGLHLAYSDFVYGLDICKRLLVPVHNGLKVYAEGTWTDGPGEKHDYMGFSAKKAKNEGVKISDFIPCVFKIDFKLGRGINPYILSFTDASFDWARFILMNGDSTEAQSSSSRRNP
jgi:hypothetical protein